MQNPNSYFLVADETEYLDNPLYKEAFDSRAFRSCEDALRHYLKSIDSKEELYHQYHREGLRLLAISLYAVEVHDDDVHETRRILMQHPVDMPMKKYRVAIHQTLVGYVTIEAPTAREAWAIADRRFNGCGEELPDMDDYENLTFEVIKEI